MELPKNLYLTEDGIVELFENIEIYYEDFSLSSSAQIGELEKKLYKCRCYCDFNGNPVKRNNVAIYSSIEPLSKKYHLIFNKYLTKSPDEYLKANRKEIDLFRQVFLEYQVSTSTFQDLTEKFDSIKANLLNSGTFTWSDFVNAIKSQVPKFEHDLFLKYGRVFSDKADHKKIKFRFDSENYRIENKTTMFNNISLF
ncbi:MAG: hypothetical protein IPK03_17020 [Bacteroidetes bacterium]|nr:hypothetical protein [Bacteroidota bacterium]